MITFLSLIAIFIPHQRSTSFHLLTNFILIVSMRGDTHRGFLFFTDTNQGGDEENDADIEEQRK